jgi:hypothetical protein
MSESIAITFQALGIMTFIIMVSVFVLWLLKKFIPEHSHHHRYEVYAVWRQNDKLDGEIIEELELCMRCRQCKKCKSVKFLNSGVKLIPAKECDVE